MSDADVTKRKRRSPSPKDRKKDPAEEEQHKKSNQLAREAQIVRSKKKEEFFNKYGYHVVIGAFIVMILFAVGSVLFRGTRKLSLIPVIDQDEILSINAQKHSFSVGDNDFFNGWMLSDAKSIINNQLTTKSSLPRCPSTEDSTIIPDSYNFREHHKECAQPIYNQGNCSSSYAIVGASVVADRYCQQSDHKIKEQLSPQPLLQCDKNLTQGCRGGSVSRVFDYAKKGGLPTTDCISYNNAFKEGDEENCKKIDGCTRYKIIDYCVTHTEEGIKREIFSNGPIAVVVPIYRDFLVYKGGIYRVVEGTSKFQSGHALKIIGWDISTSGEHYWIVENSWGESWGLNGLAHIAVG